MEPKTISARHGGTCKICGAKWAPGTPITINVGTWCSNAPCAMAQPPRDVAPETAAASPAPPSAAPAPAPAVAPAPAPAVPRIEARNVGADALANCQQVYDDVMKVRGAMATLWRAEFQSDPPPAVLGYLTKIWFERNT